MKCAYCGENFEVAANQRGRQKYCGKYCRERQWFLNNKTKHAEHQKQWRSKQVVSCKHCGEQIHTDSRKNGVRFCSEKCRQAQFVLNESKRNKHASDEFLKHKADLGCCLCPYRKFGGSLDYHHLDPTQKDRRITSKGWKTELQQIEIKKCILVCKNCHYELHYLMRHDVDEYWRTIEPYRGRLDVE